MPEDNQEQSDELGGEPAILRALRLKVISAKLAKEFFDRMPEERIEEVAQSVAEWVQTYEGRTHRARILALLSKLVGAALFIGLQHEMTSIAGPDALTKVAAANPSSLLEFGVYVGMVALLSLIHI